MVDKVTSLAVGYVCLNATGTAWLWVWLSTKQPFCFACFFSLLCGKWSCQYVAAIVDIGGFCDCLPEAEPEANNQILIFRHACCRLFSMTRLCCLTGRLRGGEQNSKRKLADDRNPRQANRAKFQWDNGHNNNNDNNNSRSFTRSSSLVALLIA
ncbi:hypothetical protein T01_7183 [Trichinella spiralis]|uniref:Uncharacterized protein n=1 Tax=Trichinella spiralis TaxID=6334 RepID=A0A0V1B623_TRISP|nr:hypothetical protein T01_7183 [Trichinella spiralis]